MLWQKKSLSQKPFNFFKGNFTSNIFSYLRAQVVNLQSSFFCKKKVVLSCGNSHINGYEHYRIVLTKSFLWNCQLKRQWK